MKLSKTAYYSAIVFLMMFGGRVCAKSVVPFSSAQLLFVENAGQLKDQFGNPRGDVHFRLQLQGLNIFVGTGQLHYQFCKADKPTVGVHERMAAHTHGEDEQQWCDGNFTFYRMDVALIGANVNAKAVAGEEQNYHENYYLPGCPEDGAHARAYKKVTYKEIYPGIDWVIYLSGNTLKHEFIVREGGDPSVIRLQYGGASKLAINDDGSLYATTPMGTIKEEPPVCKTADGKIVPSAYALEGDVLRYNLNDFKGAVVIDPVVEWATYYGPDSTFSRFYTIALDDSANVYGCGLTWADNAATIVTSGSYQTIFGGGGTDAMLVKFDSSGHRKWATYYGGNQGDYGTGIVVDTSGYIYMGGLTSSTSGISTTGSQQPTYGGGSSDAFLAKFDSLGHRIWATYAGGGGTNYPWTVSSDKQGNIYLAGDTNENTNIATPSGFQPSKSGGYDCYLIQYNTDGVRNWGTYYGGSGNEFGGVSCTDGFNVRLAGTTSSTTGLSTAFTQQPVYGGGGSDAFLVKFYADGTRAWATYYGGVSGDGVGGVACDIHQATYLLGSTSSDDAIASAGSFHDIRSGTSTDAFLAKFEPELGYRIWGTYFGGPGDENVDQSRIATDDSMHVYILGSTSSSSGIASDTAWQTTYGGGDIDAFLGKFNDDGTRVWSSYYGGAHRDLARTCVFDGTGLYVCGETSSAENIASPGAYLSTGGGSDSYSQGFIAKFIYADTTHIPPVDTSSAVAAVGQPPVSDISIFPNPNNGSLTLAGTVNDKDGVVQLTVTDITGRVVLRDEAAIVNRKVNKHLKMNNTAATGIYFLKMTLPDGAKVVQFVKQ
jgi:hypothetical protein